MHSHNEPVGPEASQTRRRFLSGTALLAAGTAGAPLATSGSSIPPAKRLPATVAVVGGEDAGLLRSLAGHPLALLKELCLVPAATAGRIARAAAKRKAAPPRQVGDWRLAVESAECVVVALPASSSGQVAEAALRAGKPVLLAGPATAELASLQASSLCQVMLPHRSQAGPQQAARYLHGGNLGQATGARVLLTAAVPMAGRASAGSRQLFQWIDLAFWTGGFDSLGAVDVVVTGGKLDHGLRRGVVVLAERGAVAFPGDDSAIAFRPDGEIARVFKGSGDPLGNFLRAVRGTSRPDAPLADCRQSSAAWNALASGPSRA